MTTYIVTRRCVTGVNEYRYYRGIEQIGKATAFLLPDYPVTLQCTGLMLRYVNDPEITRVSGISRPVFDADCGEEYARVYWDGTGRHRLYTPFGKFPVEYRDGVYAFGRRDVCIAGIRTIRKGSPLHPEWETVKEDQWEPRMAMVTTERLPDELALLMLAFPLLQLAP